MTEEDRLLRSSSGFRKLPRNATKRAEWWQGVPTVQVDVECGGHLHTLTWAEGGLHAVDHDADDEEAESVLVALGADRRRCIEVVDAWYGLDDTSAARLAVASIEKLMPPVWTARIRRDSAMPSVSLSSAPPPSIALWDTASRLRKLENLGEDLLIRRAMQGLAQLMVSSPTRSRRDDAKARLNALRQRMNLAPL